MAKDKDSGMSRQERKAKKRKLEDAVPDVPELDTTEEHAEEAEAPSKKQKTRNASRAVKDHTVGEPNVDDAARNRSEDIDATTAGDGQDEIDAPRKTKKERKKERKAREAANQAAAEGALSLAVTDQPASESKPEKTMVKETSTTKKGLEKKERKEKKNNPPREANESGKPARFIVFVGNLPFSANKASIEKHFASIKPKSVRALTKKDDPSQSKGCAFIEFDGYDHMKTCLKLFHHSEFDDGISPPRQINVELSAGGGGNSTARKRKISEKNGKLNEERARRRMEEAKAKMKEKRDGSSTSQSGVHPSRRGRVPEIG